MSADNIYEKPIAIDELLQSKKLDALPVKALDEIAKLQSLDVTGFYEQEVRTFFIDPLVRLLGYDKGSDFSVDLGRPIRFLDKNKFPDYKFHLWQESFWLIEAKRPQPDKTAFRYEDLAQAVEYAVHPEINAALVVLCDGLKIEIFDREVSLTEPVLHVDRANLSRDFDKLRVLLEPMQVWFFQKRRIIRLIDKVFDKEFNLARVEEFKALVDRRLTGKRAVVIENFRRNIKPDTAERTQHLKAAPNEELIDVHFFVKNTAADTHTLIETLVGRCAPTDFHIVHKLFPDEPRDINEWYMAHAAAFLAALSDTHPTLSAIPAWLARGGPQGGASTDTTTKYLLKQCLTFFADDEPRKVILLAAAALRRLTKLLFMSDESHWRMAELRHALARYQLDELSWSQILSSPQVQLLALLDAHAMLAGVRFVDNCRGFKTEVAKVQLRELWRLERALLAAIGDYPRLLQERNPGDASITEAAAVTFDLLGHATLCLLEPSPRWTAYALEQHRPSIERLAAMNSWKAGKLLGLEEASKPAPLNDIELADLFFFGDVETWRALRAGYGGLA
jgi:hypothetical protein